MDLVASSMPSLPGAVSRPVVNRTGLSGRYDFRIEWAPEQSASAQTVGSALSDAQGPTFLEAVKEQLGLALKPTKAPLSVMVIDHVSLPTQN